MPYVKYRMQDQNRSGIRYFTSEKDRPDDHAGRPFSFRLQAFNWMPAVLFPDFYLQWRASV